MVCFGFLKLLMMAFNFLLSLCGAVLLATGIWVIVDKRSLLQLIGPLPKQILQYVIVGYVITATGGILCLLGLLGGCSAHKESKCLLMTFFSVILIIFIVEVGAAAAIAVYSSFAESILEKWAMSALKEDYGDDEFVTLMWNNTMRMFKCCGFNNHSDFNSSLFTTTRPGKMPLPCCKPEATSCSLTDAIEANLPGCFDHIVALVTKNFKIICGVAVGVCGLQICAMIIAMYLFSQLDKRFS
ncbi:tetraspanin-1-like [Neosynchiropus ocellatus]